MRRLAPAAGRAAALVAEPFALARRRSVLHARGRIQEALSRYEAAVGEDPRLFEAWYNLGLVLESLDRVADSLRAFERAYKLRPESSDAQRSVDRLKAKGSGGRQAEEAYAQGVAAYARGEVEEAVARLRNAHTLAPQDEVITYALGAALHASGRPDEAQRHAAAVARSRSPSAKYGQLLLGALLLERGRPAEALRPLRAAVKTDSRLRDVRARLTKRGDGPLVEASHERDPTPCFPVAARLRRHGCSWRSPTSSGRPWTRRRRAWRRRCGWTTMRQTPTTHWAPSATAAGRPQRRGSTTRTRSAWILAMAPRRWPSAAWR